MTTEIEQNLSAALEPETFDVLEYLRGAPVAEDTIDIYTDVPHSKELAELKADRAEEIAKRRLAERKGEATALSLVDADEDTIYDDRINELVGILEATKLIFHTKTVAPALEKAIKKNYVAKSDPNWEKEEREEHQNVMYADILSRAIDYVSTGSGAEDRTKWTKERLMETQEELYIEQSEKLLAGLSSMVYAGGVFEDALTADFS